MKTIFNSHLSKKLDLVNIEILTFQIHKDIKMENKLSPDGRKAKISKLTIDTYLYQE
jgi:hypothetical protein